MGKRANPVHDVALRLRKLAWLKEGRISVHIASAFTLQ